MTQLCAIPGCRIWGRHLPDCDDDTCSGCLPRTTGDGLACDACTRRTSDRLDAIVQLTPDALLVASGLVRRGGGPSSGKPGSRSPINDGATDTVDEIRTTLTTTARDIAETRGLQTPRAALGGPDPLAVAAKWLTGQIEWLRHATDDQGGPYAVSVFAEIADCASKMRGIVNGPSEQKFLGPCGSTITWDGDGGEIERDRPCDGDVYGRPDAKHGTCRSCGARWATDRRRAWLDGEVRQYAFRPAHIAEAHGISDDTIRSWAARGQLKSYWRTDVGLTIEWIDPVIDPKLKDDELAEREAEVAIEVKARGGRLHYVGDVLDLAAADAARREEARAVRARRAAARAAESETAA